MTDKELIKQEIERRFNDNIKASEQYTENSKSRALFTSAAKEDYDLLAFIDSFPEEPASEDLEEEYDNFLKDPVFVKLINRNAGLVLARHFAEWQKNKMKEVLQTEYEKGRFDIREEMMKTLIGGEIVKDIHNQLSVKSESLNDTFGDIKFGDKVKIIIVKEQQ